jgi:hypothetical protein
MHRVAGAVAAGLGAAAAGVRTGAAAGASALTKAAKEAAKAQAEHLLKRARHPLRNVANQRATKGVRDVVARLSAMPLARAGDAGVFVPPPPVPAGPAALAARFPAFCKCAKEHTYILDYDEAHVITKCDECLAPGRTGIELKHRLEMEHRLAQSPPRGRSRRRGAAAAAAHALPHSQSRGRSRTRKNKEHHGRSRSLSRKTGARSHSSGR